MAHLGGTERKIWAKNGETEQKIYIFSHLALSDLFHHPSICFRFSLLLIQKYPFLLTFVN